MWIKKIGLYDCYVASTFFGDKIKTVKTFEEVNYGSGYGIIIKPGKKTKVLKVLENADWTTYASDSTHHCKHLRMNSIRQCLGENGCGSLIKDQTSLQEQFI